MEAPTASLVQVVVVATIDAAWTTLLCAAVSIVAYREIVIANERAVDVFD